MNDRVLLSFLLTQNRDEEPPVEPVVPFPAFYMEDPRICTAVLERTAILASTEDKYEKITARHDQVHVDPAMLEWRTKTTTYEGARLNLDAKRRLRASQSPWRTEMAITYAELEGDRAAQRDASDQRAISNRQQVSETKESELRLLRRQASEKPAAIQEKEEMQKRIEVVPVGESHYPTATLTTTSAVMTEKTKRCKRCGNEKPRSEFAASGIYGGYCATCEPLEKAERAAARGSKPKGEQATHKISRKVTRRRAVSHLEAAPSTSNGYDHIVKLLHRRDSLKLELAKVNEQLQEALA